MERRPGYARQPEGQRPDARQPVSRPPQRPQVPQQDAPAQYPPEYPQSNRPEKPGLIRGLRERAQDLTASEVSRLAGVVLLAALATGPVYRMFESASTPDCKLTVNKSDVSISQLRGDIYTTYGVKDPGRVEIAPAPDANGLEQPAKDITSHLTGFNIAPGSIITMSDVPTKTCVAIGASEKFGPSGPGKASDFWKDPEPILEKLNPFH